MTTPLIIIIVSCSIILALCMVYFIRKIVKLCRHLQYEKAARRLHAALEKKYGVPLTKAAARLLGEPAEKKRAEADRNRQNPSAKKAKFIPQGERI